SGMSRSKGTWQHPSIARRTEFLAGVASNPELRRRFEHRVRRLDWLLVSSVLVPAVIAIFA
ncbi:MAG: hypothetical protein ACYC6Y_24030, partial [Thermoguttaceae bacterium]